MPYKFIVKIEKGGIAMEVEVMARDPNEAKAQALRLHPGYRLAAGMWRIYRAFMTEKLKAILEVEGLSSLLNKFNEQGVTDSILGDLTDSDLKELGVDKLGERKRLLAAFGKSGGASASSVVEESSVQTSGGAPSKTASSPAEATKDSPWVNTQESISKRVPMLGIRTQSHGWP